MISVLCHFSSFYEFYLTSSWTTAKFCLLEKVGFVKEKAQSSKLEGLNKSVVIASSSHVKQVLEAQSQAIPWEYWIGIELLSLDTTKVTNIEERHDQSLKIVSRSRNERLSDGDGQRGEERGAPLVDRRSGRDTMTQVIEEGAGSKIVIKGTLMEGKPFIWAW